MREFAQAPLLDPERLHALRIALKNARYTLELMDDQAHEQILLALRRTQDQLGVIHDLDHALEVLHRWEPQLVRDGAAPGAPDFPGLLERAGDARATQLADWQSQFPLNGSELFARAAGARAGAGGHTCAGGRAHLTLSQSLGDAFTRVLERSRLSCSA